MSDTKRFRALFVSKDSVAEEIAKEAVGLFRIEESSCSPVLPVPLGQLSAQERVLLELMTRYICYLAGTAKSPALSRSELSARCRLADTVLRARLSDLRKTGFIESGEDGEAITASGLIEMKEFLGELRTKHAAQTDHDKTATGG